MKKPMTTEELFNKSYGILKEKDKLPDTLDYGLATSDPVPIRTYEFELKNNLDYGAVKGFIWICGLCIMMTEKDRRKDLVHLKPYLRVMRQCTLWQLC